ncbi:sulfatase [Haloferula helveola]|uniref:Sulfatase n=1 Tax=Haloferula helveola TaxID=490095 RepID=A0ABN6H5A9_9BACT|nr:sulfatase [Haloferula helveola]
MNPLSLQDALNRRTFLRSSAHGFGLAALGSMFGSNAMGGVPLLDKPHHLPKAKRVIYLFQSGAPSQMDLFDPKPMLEKRFGEELPDSIRQGQRITGMTSGQKTLPVAPSKFKFAQYGQSGAWVSELMPETAKIVDDLCIIRSMHTEAINHDPAVTFFQSGSQLAGRPSIGSWVSYGLGSSNSDLPNYVVLTSRGTGRPNDQPLADRYWGAGFLPTEHSGVKFRNAGDPVLYLSDPAGIDRVRRRDMLDDLAALNQRRHGIVGDPEIAARIAQYEMAFRMQASVPELTDVSGESETVLGMYGPDVKKPGTYAANCLLARRLAERGVRFIQLFHQGWDHHGGLPKALAGQCRDTDHATAGLLRDLKQRGLLEDTLVVWGGEFGRTIYSQGKLTRENYGRDHHPRCFTMWLAGAGVRKGVTIGSTDDYSYNIVEDPVHVHDLNATILHLLGVDHEKLVFKYQGRQYRLTDVHGHLVRKAMA